MTRYSKRYLKSATTCAWFTNTRIQSIISRAYLKRMINSQLWFGYLGTKELNLGSVPYHNSVHSEQYCAWTIDPLSVHNIINGVGSTSVVIAYILLCTSCFEKTAARALMTEYLYLTGGNWQKWKRVFLTCPCHEIYRDEAVGLKSCKNTWKITIFVKMWNLGQYRKNLIFCQ